MLAAAVIVLRESFEAALLIGIIAAATRSIAGRGRWIGGGVALGLAGACVVAALTGEIASLFDGAGQELFNVSILVIAVAMLGWHNVWMAAHGTEMSADARRVGHEVEEGKRELSTVLVVIAMAVLREGSETVLFLYGLLTSGETTTGSVIGGAALGLIAGAALGLVLYSGIVRIPMRWFFSVTAGLILLIAAGMASRIAQLLIQADLLPSLKTPVWDTSSLLPTDSLIGNVLHVLIGYEAAPSGMQVVFYAVTALIILAGMWSVRRTPALRPAH